MTMEELMADREEDGRRAGRKEGRDLILKLVSLMVQDGLTAEIPKLENDAEYCESMLKKYNLK